MSRSITGCVREIKADLRSIVRPALIMRLCTEAGHEWRSRTLGPVETIYLFITQILYGNTSCAHVRHFGDFAFTTSAYCQARQRLPVRVCTALLRETGRIVSREAARVGLWHGHRVLSVDGSSFTMPDRKSLQAFFRWNPNRKGVEFPVCKFVALFDLITGAMLDLSPATMRDHELRIVQPLRAHMQPNDIVVADRLYGAFSFLGQLLGSESHFVVRLATGSRTVDFRPHRPHAKRANLKGPRSIWLRRLGHLDQIVEWIKPDKRPVWMSQADWDRIPQHIRVRELRYRVKRRGFRSREVTIATSLLDHETYPAREIAELYGRRWQIEVNLRDLKTTMGMDVVRCHTLDGVMREVAIFGVVHNAVRLVMVHAAEIEGVTPDRISFIDVLRWLMLSAPQFAPPRFIVNQRRTRTPAPRMKKRRHKTYNYMTRPRQPQKTLRGHDIPAI